MERGAIDCESVPGGLDLFRTIESGQSYLWRRSDDACYQNVSAEDAWYETALDLEAAAIGEDGSGTDVVRIRQHDGTLEWEATTDPVPALRRMLRLEDDLEAIRTSVPDDPLVTDAFDAHWGMRLVNDPPFATLVSFICSAQMRVERIHGMVTALARAYGTHVTVGDRTIHAIPTANQLAAATEADLRSLGLGYRAPYVLETARMVADGEDPTAARTLEYEAAREHLTRFVGVGEKVADCVLLFSLGFDEAVPLDTWIRSAIASHYPDCDRGTYRETSRAIRERFGGTYAGYAQTYVFHHLRTG